jgi:hypothetical protein
MRLFITLADLLSRRKWFSECIPDTRGQKKYCAERRNGLDLDRGYVTLVVVFAGAQTVPAFHSIVSNVFFRINDVVRGLMGG